MKRRLISFLLLVLGLVTATAKPDKLTEVLVAPESGLWVSAVDSDVRFVITVLNSNVPADGAVDYEISPDLMPPVAKGRLTLTDGKAVTPPVKLSEPGFVRCKAVYGSYSGLGTIGISPENISPVTACPDDFDDFWAKTLEEARATALQPVLEHIAEASSPDVDVYRASWNSGKNRYYGMLAIPRGGESYPAVVQYPGAGVYKINANADLARRGVITLAFNPHGIAPDMEDNIYSDLGRTALRDYPSANAGDRDRYYYRQMVAGAVRAVDFLQQLPQCNGRIATYGGSQGGYLSVAVSALHPGVGFTEARYPALSDMAGYTRGRAGGWPHLLRGKTADSPEARALAYYDTVNFARRLTAPVAMAFGFNDLTCAPTTTYGVYNAITAPKTLTVAPLMGHACTSEQLESQNAATVAFLTQP